MAEHLFKGLGIALVTPFTENGDVDYSALKQLIHYQLDNGADFFCILATTGETPTLKPMERHRIKDTVVEVVNGKVPILMGCGGNDTASVVHELKEGDF
nr:dihydrodipicolinate synthase family protein [Prevotella sp.]